MVYFGYRGPVAVARPDSGKDPVRLSRSVIASALVLAGMSAAGIVAAIAESPESPESTTVVVDATGLSGGGVQPPPDTTH